MPSHCLICLTTPPYSLWQNMVLFEYSPLQGTTELISEGNGSFYMSLLSLFVNIDSIARPM